MTNGASDERSSPGPLEPNEADPDPHGATDPVTREEYVGRRSGLRGLWDSLAYGVQYAALSIYGPAPQSEDSDPIARLRRKYGRPERRY